MNIHFNAEGKERKHLAAEIASWLGEDLHYRGVPSCAYEAGKFTIDKASNLIADDSEIDSETAERLLEHLYEEGFESDVSLIERKLEETPSIDSIEEIDGITLSFPDSGFDDAAFERLESLVKAKANLIGKAFDAKSTDVIWNKEEKTIAFPWFKFDLSKEEDEKLAAVLFLSKLMDFAKNAKRTTAKEKETDNEKYAFRCFLLRLGFIGDEFKGARKILLSHLSGNSAFRSGKEKEAE